MSKTVLWDLKATDRNGKPVGPQPVELFTVDAFEALATDPERYTRTEPAHDEDEAPARKAKRVKEPEPDA